MLYNHANVSNAHAKDAERILYTRGMSMRTLSRGSGTICAHARMNIRMLNILLVLNISNIRV
jgi:hypothetical protein